MKTERNEIGTKAEWEWERVGEIMYKKGLGIKVVWGGNEKGAVGKDCVR